MPNLHEDVERKFIDTIDVNDWEIETDTGWQDVSHVHKTIPYKRWIVKTETGKELLCADTHIVFDENLNEIFVQDLIPNQSYIKTKQGNELVVWLEETDIYENMYDLTVKSEDHRFYSNDILSHNSITTAAFILWYVFFNSDKTVAILANKAPVAREILSRIVTAYETIPYFLQPGAKVLNKGSVELGNNSRIIAAATSSTAIRGFSCVVLPTKVTIKTPEGEIKSVSIEELIVSLNKTFHPNNKRFEVLTDEGFKNFSGIRIQESSNGIFNIKTISTELNCTNDHRIYSNSHNDYIEAQLLKIGDSILTENGEESIIDISFSSSNELVADLVGVDSTNSYYTNNILSHNCNLLYLDEFAHVENADSFFKSTYPTISSGKETKVIISSTPDGLNLFYKLFIDAQKQINDFIAFEIAWYEVPGRDEKWKQEQIEILGEKGFNQEFDGEFLGSSNTLISGDALRSLASPKPIFEDIETCINCEPIEGNRYMCFVDVSGGVGLDYSTITVIDITDSPYRISYTWRSNKVSAYDLSSIIVPIAQKYNDAFLFVERNALGRTVAEDCHYSYEYENIAMTTMVNKRQTLTGGFGSGRTEFGVEMSPLVKKIGCAALKNMIESNILLDLTMEQIYELSNFVSYRKTYAAEKGKHDDFVMNLVLFAWATKQKYFDLIKEEETYKQEQENPDNDFNTPFGIINSDMYEEMEDIKWLFN